MVDFIPLRFKGPGEIPDGTERCFRPTARESSLPLAEDGKRRTRTSFPITDQKKFVICPFDIREPKNRRLCERLTQCFAFEAGNALLNAALIRQDERMLLEVQGVDVIVRKVLYHRSCYSLSTHRKTLQKLAKIEVEAEMPLRFKDLSICKRFKNWRNILSGASWESQLMSSTFQDYVRNIATS